MKEIIMMYIQWVKIYVRLKYEEIIQKISYYLTAVKCPDGGYEKMENVSR